MDLECDLTLSLAWHYKFFNGCIMITVREMRNMVNRCRTLYPIEVSVVEWSTANERNKIETTGT